MFTSTQLKLAGLAIVLFIISLFFLNVEHKNTKIEKLSNANVIAELHLDTAVSTIEETKKASVITQAITKDFVKEVEVIKDKGQANLKAVHDKVKELDYNYSVNPKTAELKQQHENQVSEVRIKGIWDSYCSSEPDDTECKPA